MSISLRETAANDFWQCINSTVAKEQEPFVGTNVRSIAESRVYPYLAPLVIYNDDSEIGFVLYGRDPETEKYWIDRFIIGAQYQRKGHSKQALAALIEKIKKLPEADKSFLSLVLGNIGARSFITVSALGKQAKSMTAANLLCGSH
jgi:diamine N-acetyltransferase